MVDKIFNEVVDGLEKAANKLHITYNAINVYGMFAWMGLTAGLVTKTMLDKKTIKKLKKRLK
jgi:hypothetical protein